MVLHSYLPFNYVIEDSESCRIYYLSFQYSGLISYFAERAKATVKAMDPTNELEYLRVTSKRHEILVAPDNDFVLIVMQNPGE